MLKHFLLMIIVNTTNFGFCSDRFMIEAPLEIIVEILDVRIHETNCISINRLLVLRNVCKSYNQRIIQMINSHQQSLVDFYASIRFKRVMHIEKPKASFLKQFPNLRTRLHPEITAVYHYLLNQDFSFCTNEQEYAALYAKQERKTIESLDWLKRWLHVKWLTRYRLSPITTMTEVYGGWISYESTIAEDNALKYGILNHGTQVSETGIECCFSHIGFLFFDPHFCPPKQFWGKPWGKNSINPINVLTSLSFNIFFQKALKNFVYKIPKALKKKIITPVINISSKIYSKKNYSEHCDIYFKLYTKPLLQKELDHLNN